jgi:hypothetical protein
MSGRMLGVLFLSLALLTLSLFVGPPLEGARGEFILWQLRVPRMLGWPGNGALGLQADAPGGPS